MDIHDRSRAEVAAWVRAVVLIRSASYEINDDNYTIMPRINQLALTV